MNKYIYHLDDSLLSDFEKNFYNKYDSSLHPQQPYFNILCENID